MVDWKAMQKCVFCRLPTIDFMDEELIVMISKEAITAAKEAYDIEAACITEMKNYFDEEQFAKAVELLSAAPRIGAAGCGHSGIICQHFAHLSFIPTLPGKLFYVSELEGPLVAECN